MTEIPELPAPYLLLKGSATTSVSCEHGDKLVLFTDADMRSFYALGVREERERCANIAESHDAELVAFLIRGVPERNAPRLVDGFWYWDERDEQGQWQNCRSEKRPEWAIRTEAAKTAAGEAHD